MQERADYQIDIKIDIISSLSCPENAALCTRLRALSFGLVEPN
jgi:hypothetical protein